MTWDIHCRDPSLGLRTKVKASKGMGQEECESVWGWKLTLPNELTLWELESWWTPELSKNNCRGQNTLHWRVLYIIGNLLKCRCLKWLSWPIWTSVTQVMTKRKAESQTGNLTPDHEKLGINPTSMRAGGVRHTIGNLLTRAITLL